MPRPRSRISCHDRAVDVLQVHVGDQLAIGVEEGNGSPPPKAEWPLSKQKPSRLGIQPLGEAGRSRAASRRRCRRGSGRRRQVAALAAAFGRAVGVCGQQVEAGVRSQVSGSCSMRPAPARGRARRRRRRSARPAATPSGGGRLVQQASERSRNRSPRSTCSPARAAWAGTSRPDRGRARPAPRRRRRRHRSSREGPARCRRSRRRRSRRARSIGSGRPASSAVSSKMPNETGAEAMFMESPLRPGAPAGRVDVESQVSRVQARSGSSSAAIDRCRRPGHSGSSRRSRGRSRTGGSRAAPSARRGRAPSRSRQGCRRGVEPLHPERLGRPNR